MSTNLVDLEADPGRTRLDQTPLTGTTFARWDEARSALAYLWQWFTQLNDLLDAASRIRGTKARLDAGELAQLDQLLNGPSIQLSTADVPLAQRGLLGAAETTIRCSPPELLSRMQTAFAQVVAVITACSQKWSAAEAKLGPLASQLAASQRVAEHIGEQHHPELDQVSSQISQLRQNVMCDPLAMDDVSAVVIATRLGAVAQDLGRLSQLRDNLDGQLSDARDLMTLLGTTTTAAADARSAALTKIANPTVIDPRTVAGNVAVELERVVTMSGQGDWRAAANLLTQWTTRCRDALTEAQRALAANQAPLAARDELRGRLDAYRAKANRLGLLEDPTVAALYARAKSALFNAPTDLNLAEQLVQRYQQALTGPTPREVAT